MTASQKTRTKQKMTFLIRPIFTWLGYFAVGLLLAIFKPWSWKRF